MKDFIKTPTIFMPSTSISVPVTESVAKVLKTMFNTQIGSLELMMDETGLNSPHLLISCYLRNEENHNKWDDLKRMYSVKQLDDYNKLRHLVYGIIDDYYELEDEKILYKYKLSDMEEDSELDREEDYEEARF